MSSYLIVTHPVNSQPGTAGLELPTAQPGDKVASVIVLASNISGYPQWMDVTNLFNSEPVQKLHLPSPIQGICPGDGVPFIVQTALPTDISVLTILLLMNRG